MFACCNRLWATALMAVAGAGPGCQADAPHVSVHSLLDVESYQVELDGELVVDELAPDEATAFVAVPERDEPLSLDLYSVGLNGEPSPQVFELSDLLGYRDVFDCWVVYVEPCLEEPGAFCAAAQRTVYDGLLQGCINEPL